MHARLSQSFAARNVGAHGDIHSLVASEITSSKQPSSTEDLALEDRLESDPDPMRTDPGFGVRPFKPGPEPGLADQEPLSLLKEPLTKTGLPARAQSAVKRASANPHRNRLNLYIMRHASAGTRRANEKLDVKRSLDKEGKQHCFHLAHVLNGLKLNFDLVVSSPLKRCLQTAQLIGTETGYEAKILHSDALRPDADFAHFQRLVHECRMYESVLMVGHNPTLTYFLGQLIGGVSVAGDTSAMARVRLRKGSIARVTLERGPGLLQWMLEPRIVRALYTTSTKSSRRKTSRK